MMSKKKTDSDYDVGYGKPPKHTRFKKGRSGNPKGRPKGSRNFSTDLKATLGQGVRVNAGGQPRTISTQLALLMRLREKALNGDARAMDLYVELARTYNDEEIAEAMRLSQSDAEILDGFLARQLRETKEPETADEGDTAEGSGRGQDGSKRDNGDSAEGDDNHDVLR